MSSLTLHIYIALAFIKIRERDCNAMWGLGQPIVR